MSEASHPTLAPLDLSGLQALSAILEEAARIGVALDGAELRPRFALSVETGPAGGRITVGIIADDGNSGRREFALCVRDWSRA